MCGICGILNRDFVTPVSSALIEHMAGLLAHRGPEAEGFFADPGIGLGHRRLKIIDLEGGIQPMYSADEDIVVIFNGEIYNFAEVRASLERAGHQFRTNSDTEVIIEAYRAHGEACVEYFRGMFAIALYDRPRRKLLLIRDRLGIKPLYYHLDDQRLIFASEVKPVLQALERKPAVNRGALDFYLSVGYVPGEATLFDSIRKLQPGHMMIVEHGRCEIRPYWDLENRAADATDEEDAARGFTELLAESIELRMISDVPIGAFLSGGVDSSVVVGMMSRLSDDPVKTFSVGYEDDENASELAYARIVARHFNTDHHEYILKPLDFFDSMDLLLEHAEEPIVESAAVALLQLSRLAKREVTVILSGEGGDEILAGYPLHQTMPKLDRIHAWLRYLPNFARDAVGAAFAGHEKMTKYWDWAQMPLERRYQSISNDVTLSIKRRMYRDASLLDAHRETADYYAELFARLSRGSRLRKMTYSDLKSWLPDDLLVKADKMTMAASLELRVPFLDHKLVEYATALPDRLRLNGQHGKYLLKKYAETLLPHEIVYRRKQGFPVPISSWFRNELYTRTAEILLDRSSLDRGYFNPEYIENLLRRHRQGREDLSRRIFALLNLELWHRKYMDSAA